MLFNKRDALFICALLLSQMINWYLSTAAFIFLTVYSLKGVVESIKALSLLPYLYLANNALFLSSPFWSIARWVVLLTASAVLLKTYYKKKLPIPKWFGFLMLFNTIALTSSILYSYELTVSIIKLLIFTIVFSSILLGYKTIAKDFKPWYFTLYSTVLVFSTFLIPTPLGYIRNNFGFQGIFNQPNGYGVYLAPFCAWIVAKVIIDRKIKKILIFFSGIVIMNLFLSRSRTALFAVVLSILIAFIVSLMGQTSGKAAKKDKGSNRLIKRILIVMNVIAVIILSPYLFSSRNIIIEKVTSFIYKKKNETENEKTLLKSREKTIEISMRGFKKNPIIGIGFGVSADPKHFRSEKTKIGIPTSGSAEKGNLIIALLEETGIVGLITFSIFIFVLFKPILKAKQYEAIVLFVTAIMVNMGEMVFFSPGGLGTQIFLILGFARSLTCQKNESEIVQSKCYKEAIAMQN